MALLTFSIASWNTKELTKQTLESLYRNTRLKDFEVVIVDNASTDGSQRMIKKEFPQVKLIENEVNVGFGRAHNKAVRASEGKYVCILNSDVVVLPRAFDIMVDFLEKNQNYSVVTNKLLNTDMTLQESIAFFPVLWYEFVSRIPFVHHFYNWHRVFDHDKEQDIETFNGACYIVRRSDFEKAGMFDECLFAYMGETDLFFRMKQMKMKIRYLPFVKIVHYGGASTASWADRNIMYYTNLLQFFKKEYGDTTLGLVRSIVGASNILSIIKYPVIKVLPDSHKKQLELREMDLALKLLKINTAGKIKLS
ncbi:MAG: glycosyltransferase family 2 protein [Armatimonadota bacterium]